MLRSVILLASLGLGATQLPRGVGARMGVPVGGAVAAGGAQKSLQAQAADLKAQGVTAEQLCHLATTACQCARAAKKCGWNGAQCVAKSSGHETSCLECADQEKCGGSGTSSARTAISGQGVSASNPAAEASNPAAEASNPAAEAAQVAAAEQAKAYEKAMKKAAKKAAEKAEEEAEKVKKQEKQAKAMKQMQLRKAAANPARSASFMPLMYMRDEQTGAIDRETFGNYMVREERKRLSSGNRQLWKMMENNMHEENVAHDPIDQLPMLMMMASNNMDNDAPRGMFGNMASSMRMMMVMSLLGGNDNHQQQPAYTTPSYGYAAPYAAPAQSYGAYAAPAQSYGAYAAPYAAPYSGYAAPVRGYGYPGF